MSGFMNNQTWGGQKIKGARIVNRSRFGHSPRRMVLSMLLLMIIGAMSFPVFGQDATPTPAETPRFTTLTQAWFPGIVIQGTFTEVVRVFDFPQGTGTGLHTHGGPTLLSMIDGTLTLRQNEVDHAYGAWEYWAEMPNVVHEAFNDGETTARVIASYLVPEGSQPAVPQGESDRPAGTKLIEAQFPGLTMDGMFTELMRVIDFPPGSTTGLHMHGGPTFLIMIDGALTLRQDGVETVYAAGESWSEIPGMEHEAFNAGDVTARVIAVYLLPMAAPTTLIQQ